MNTPNLDKLMAIASQPPRQHYNPNEHPADAQGALRWLFYHHGPALVAALKKVQKSTYDRWKQMADCAGDSINHSTIHADLLWCDSLYAEIDKLLTLIDQEATCQK